MNTIHIYATDEHVIDGYIMVRNEDGTFYAYTGLCGDEYNVPLAY